jgi:hypothetical protein
MKEWIIGLCPEIAEWQAEMIAEAAQNSVLAEREACAKVVEDYPHWIGLTAKAEISNAIRARGER